MNAAELLTTGGVAEKVGRPLHVVVYAIRCAGLKPAGRAGTLRLWGASQIVQIEEALHRVRRYRHVGAVSDVDVVHVGGTGHE